MTPVLAGALALAMAVTCALVAPLGGRSLGLNILHPDAIALRQAAWIRPLWQWEAIRMSCVTACVLLALATGLPVLPAAVSGALAPSFLARSHADAARRRARPETTRLLRATEAG